jgi:hypothetical protein
MLSYLGLKKAKQENADEKPEAASKKKKENKEVEAKLWLFLTKKYRGKVRSSCLVFLA